MATEVRNLGLGQPMGEERRISSGSASNCSKSSTKSESAFPIHQLSLLSRPCKKALFANGKKQVENSRQLMEHLEEAERKMLSANVPSYTPETLAAAIDAASANGNAFVFAYFKNNVSAGKLGDAVPSTVTLSNRNVKTLIENGEFKVVTLGLTITR